MFTVCKDWKQNNNQKHNEVCPYQSKEWILKKFTWQKTFQEKCVPLLISTWLDKIYLKIFSKHIFSKLIFVQPFPELQISQIKLS